MEDLEQLCVRDTSPDDFSLPSAPDDFEISDGPLPNAEHPGHSTGPRTSEGKARSSQNSVTHGCRSKILLLPGERQEDFDILYDRWMSAYDPEDDATRELVEHLILEKWFLERNIRRYLQLEQELAKVDFISWTDQQHKNFQLALRYKTTAERSVGRAMAALDARVKVAKNDQKDFHRTKDQLHATEIGLFETRAEHLLESKKFDSIIDQKIYKAQLLNVDVSQEQAAVTESRSQYAATIQRINKKLAVPAEPKTLAQETFQGQNAKKNQRKIVIMEQWLEITVEDGKTCTWVQPSNEQLIEEGKAMDPPPELVYRRCNFVNGVPPEYHWATKDEERRRIGMCGIQRMTVDTWLVLIEREKANGTGHIGPTGVGNLPRPKERGGCDCEVCSHNRAILERRAQKLEPEPEA